MVFSILENVIYLKNINLYASVSQCISLKNTFVQVDYYGVSYTWIYFPAEKYTPPCQLTKLMFSTLGNIFRRNYSSVQVFLDFLIEKYLPPCELTKMVFLHLKMFFTWRIYTFNGVDKIENIIYLKNVHLYASVFPLENIYLCACTQKWCFLSLKCLLLKEYTPLCKFSSIRNIHLFWGD